MRLGSALLFAVALTVSSNVAFASQIPTSQVSSIVAFGDSLSDAGNVSISTLGALPPAGYATRSVPGVPFPVGYYTNPQTGGGPAGLWVDQFASKLGVADPLPFLAGGSNFAVGDAFTNGFNGVVPGMNTQVGLFLSSVSGQAPSSALYTFWGGANDLFNGLNPTTAADSIASEIAAVHAAGGQNFVWLNLPPLGQTPALNGNPVLSGIANGASAQFDSEWALQLQALNAAGINVIGVDIASLFDQVLANPAQFGFTNVTTACLTTPGCNANNFLYWDSIHPTTAADALVADAAFSNVAATPEPPSVALLATGIVCIVACWWFNRNREDAALASSR